LSQRVLQLPLELAYHVLVEVVLALEVLSSLKELMCLALVLGLFYFRLFKRS
jgi:hypothetical protein